MYIGSDRVNAESLKQPQINCPFLFLFFFFFQFICECQFKVHKVHSRAVLKVCAKVCGNLKRHVCNCENPKTGSFTLAMQCSRLSCKQEISVEALQVFFSYFFAID